MANPQHCKVFDDVFNDPNRDRTEGVRIWNEWRKCNPEQVPDLSRIERTNLYLVGANLRGVDLSYSRVTDWYLFGADLREANLQGARFESGTELAGAKLNCTNLRKAIFHQSVFADETEDTRFGPTDFTGAVMSETIFANVDLRNCKGLKAVHIDVATPLTIGIDTLLNSKGEIPNELLRLSGMSEAAIMSARKWFAPVL